MPSPKNPKALLPCNNCEEVVVRPRRRSADGNHWCSKRECQNAKARHYGKVARERQKEAEAKVGESAHDIGALQAQLDIAQRDFNAAHQAFLRAALADRVTCPDCGLEDAVDGFPHRNSGNGPCFGLGPSRGPALAIPFLDIAMPEPRTYQEV